MFHIIISALFLFISINAFAGGRTEIDVIWAEVDDVREEIKGHEARIRRLEQRRQKLCDSPAGNREVVCQQDLRPLLNSISRLNNTCLRTENDRLSLVCQDQLKVVNERAKTAEKKLRKRLAGLEQIVTSRRYSLGVSFGPQGTFVSTYGAVGLLSTNLSLTYETAYMGVSIQGGSQLAPNLTAVGGGVTASLFWKVNGLDSLALGPLLGGEINDYGLDGSYYQHRVYGPVAGGFLRFTPVEENVVALDFTLRGGVKTGVHNIAPGVIGGNGSNELAMTPFIAAQIEVRFFVRD